MPAHAVPRRGLAAAGAGVALAAAALGMGGPGIAAAAGRAGPSAPPAASIPPPAPPIDGIACDQGDRQALHIHAHLAVYARGVAQMVPAGVGIVGPVLEHTSRGPLVVAGLCYYWLHTHSTDGIIHVEAPYLRPFTLGEFFDIWGKSLGAHQIGSHRGSVTAYVDGTRVLGDPHLVRLTDHAVIQLDVGVDTPPQPYWFGLTPGPFLLTGVAAAVMAALATLATTWSWHARLLATCLAFVLVASWRTACGLLGVDTAGPVGGAVVECGSLVAGGLGAALIATRGGPGGVTRWLPAAAGAAGAGLAAALL